LQKKKRLWECGGTAGAARVAVGALGQPAARRPDEGDERVGWENWRVGGSSRERCTSAARPSSARLRRPRNLSLEM